MKKGDKVLNRPIVNKKTHTKRKIRWSTLQTQKIQQLWAINEYQKTAYPSRAHTPRRWRERSEKRDRESEPNCQKKAKQSSQGEVKRVYNPRFEEKAKPRKVCKHWAVVSHRNQSKHGCFDNNKRAQELSRLSHHSPTCHRTRERETSRCVVVGRARVSFPVGPELEKNRYFKKLDIFILKLFAWWLTPIEAGDHASPSKLQISSRS